MAHSLFEQRKQGVLVAAHRGTSGGNVIQNTSLAYRNSLFQQADMIEVDVTMSKDGEFYAFHDGQEPLVLGKEVDIRELNASQIDAFHCVNQIGEPVTQKLEKVFDILTEFAPQCFINIDRSWFYWETFLPKLENVKALDKIVLKSPVKKELLEQLVRYSRAIQYMPIVKSLADLAVLAEYPTLNVVAVELVFDSLEHELVQADVLTSLKAKGWLLWVNVITLNDTTILSGGLDDNQAIAQGPDSSWGVWVERGFDILQTDWPLALKTYLGNKTK